MPAKKTPDPNQKPQKQRFIEFARDHGADRDQKALERAFPKVAEYKSRERS